jgi:hypothetical protein
MNVTNSPEQGGGATAPQAEALRLILGRAMRVDGKRMGSPQD